MPKSKSRKNHSKKVSHRNLTIKNEKRKQEKIQKGFIEALSKASENPEALAEFYASVTGKEMPVIENNVDGDGETIKDN